MPFATHSVGLITIAIIGQRYSVIRLNWFDFCLSKSNLPFIGANQNLTNKSWHLTPDTRHPTHVYNQRTTTITIWILFPFVLCLSLFVPIEFVLNLLWNLRRCKQNRKTTTKWQKEKEILEGKNNASEFEWKRMRNQYKITKKIHQDYYLV